MNREDILEKSRSENSGGDERDRFVHARAGQIATAVAGIVSFVILFLEVMLTDNVNCSVWAVFLSMTGTSLVVKYNYLKKRHDLVIGIAELVMAAVFFALHIIKNAHG